MKGIIIAGGIGSRLNPLTRITNKNLLPIYNKPLIYYPIETLKSCGIKEIMIVSGKNHAGQYLELLSSGKDIDVNFSYCIQEKPGGIAQALGLCEDFADEEDILVILGDNIYENNDEIKEEVKKYTLFGRRKKWTPAAFFDENKGAKIFLKKVEDPERFGVAEVDSDSKKVVKINEKPKNPTTNLAVTGLYLYDSRVWDFIRELTPSNRGELEITDVNNKYCEAGELTYFEVEGEWIDCGTFDSMLEASILMAQKSGVNVQKFIREI